MNGDFLDMPVQSNYLPRSVKPDHINKLSLSINEQLLDLKQG